MGPYVVRRLLSGVVLVFAITLVTFVVFRLIPQVPACILVPCGPHTTTSDPQIRAANHRIGADRPWRHFIAMRATEHADVEIRELAVECLRQLQKAAANVFDDFEISTLPDGTEVASSPFVIGLGLRKAFSEHLHLVPDGRYCHLVHVHAPPQPTNVAPQFLPPPPCGGPAVWAYHLILPWLTFAIFFLPLYTRMIRTRLLETIDEQHVVTARAKGASELRVVLRHVLRPALLPLVTMIGMDLGAALTAAIYIETIYGFGGLGALMLSTLSNPAGTFDLPVIGAIFFVVAVTIVLLNLIVDLLYTWLDPRIRLVRPETT